MLSMMRGVGQQIVARFVETFLKPSFHGDIRVFDLRPGTQSLAVVDEAVDHLRSGAPEYLRLVRENLDAVHVSRGKSNVLVPPRVFATPLHGRELTDGVCLASRLVWTARYINDRSGRAGSLPSESERRLRVRAYEHQLAFVRSTGYQPLWLPKLEYEMEGLAS
jgi:hypothetical protein